MSNLHYGGIGEFTVSSRCGLVSICIIENFHRWSLELIHKGRSISQTPCMVCSPSMIITPWGVVIIEWINNSFELITLLTTPMTATWFLGIIYYQYRGHTSRDACMTLFDWFWEGDWASQSRGGHGQSRDFDLSMPHVLCRPKEAIWEEF